MELRCLWYISGDSITGDAGRNILHGGEGGTIFLVGAVRTDLRWWAPICVWW